MKRLLPVGSIIVVVIGAIFVTAIIVQAIPRYSSLRYIEQATGITFPSRVFQIDVFDSADFYVTAHVKMRQEDVASFASREGLGASPIDVTPWIEALRPENRTFPNSADLWYSEGRSNSNRWLCALDKNGGHLWIVVFYPDPSGASP
jgi:hypothetical protein